MYISSINSYRINPTHKAVNQKYLKQAVENYQKYAPCHDQGHLLTCISLQVAYKLMSPKDGIDTLEAIKPYAQNALEVIEDLLDSFEKLKKTNR